MLDGAPEKGVAATSTGTLAAFSAPNTACAVAKPPSILNKNLQIKENYKQLILLMIYDNLYPESVAVSGHRYRMLLKSFLITCNSSAVQAPTIPKSLVRETKVVFVDIFQTTILIVYAVHFHDHSIVFVPISFEVSKWK